MYGCHTNPLTSSMFIKESYLKESASKFLLARGKSVTSTSWL